MTDFFTNHTLIKGGIMGVVIAALDMALRPKMAGGLQEILLFGLEGFSCYLVYKFGSTPAGSHTCGNIFGQDPSMFYLTLVGGLTIWITDLFLRPQNMFGAGMEMFKFILQGMIVVFAFGAVA